MIIVYAFIFPEVEGCERDAETVLIVVQAYLLAAVEYSIDWSVGRRTYQQVVDLQIAEHQGDSPQCVDIRGVKHRDTIRTAKHQTAVRQLA